MCRRDEALDELKSKKENGVGGNNSDGQQVDACEAVASGEVGYTWIDMSRNSLDLITQLVRSACDGHGLSRLTFLTFILAACQLAAKPESYIFPMALALCISVLSLGYATLLALYHHSVRIIFNSIHPKKYFPSYLVHWSLLKPLEVLWRYTTARWRVLPDVIVLGEVRCGTTTLCQHLASIKGFHEPFCLWKHPELDKKETFFFVGHYLGVVDPTLYSMCFPLCVTRFISRRLLGRPFFTFEGCAQYLTSPSAPHLIAKAYKAAGQPPPILVACVRDPVDQALSWYTYEHNAISWGKDMGLQQNHPTLRPKNYPPTSVTSAVAFSSSEDVHRMYKEAESKAKEIRTKQTSVTAPYIGLPDWALTWPAGQLSGITRNGKYAENIQRYEDVFQATFADQKACGIFPDSSHLSFLNVIPLEVITNESQLTLALESITAQVNHRSRDSPSAQLGQRKRKTVHRNASASLPQGVILPTSEEKSALVEVFESDTRRLEAMCGMNLGWKTSLKR